MTDQRPYAVMTRTKQYKNPNTKTTWITEDVITKPITQEQYNNIVTASPFFRRLGGIETHIKSYTARGYLTVELRSTSPDKQNRSVYKFDLDIPINPDQPHQ